MGTERWKNRKHLFFHGTGILVSMLLFAGCVTTPTFQKNWQGQRHLKLAERLLKKGAYADALREYGQVIKIFPSDSPGDKALFYMGIICAHPNYPKRDYEQSLEYFQRLAHNFPQSSLREEANVWISVINQYDGCMVRVKKLEKTGMHIKKELNALKKTDTDCRARVEALEDKVEFLRERLNALKEIDIGIEERKRQDMQDKTGR